MRYHGLLMLMILASSGCGDSQLFSYPGAGDDLYRQGKEIAEQRADIQPVIGQAKNVILVVGDGMGVTTLTAARIFAGQKQGMPGEEYALSFERFPYSGLVKTYNTDYQTPDSAGTMTALITGVKTRAGMLSLPQSVKRGECPEQGNDLNTLVDDAKRSGRLTAVVTTARITHATPAATFAHASERNWESDDRMPEDILAEGCIDIAQQLIQNNAGRPDILLGGGLRHFLPQEEGGRRNDGRNLIQEWKEKTGGSFADSESSARELTGKPFPWLGIFSRSHMDYEFQRADDQPSLLNMTKTALNAVSGNENGYLMIIESGRIDHGHHEGQAYKALTETEMLDQTVRWLSENTNPEETLIVVTADHSHTLSLAGSPTRGNNILGYVSGNNIFGRASSDVAEDDHGHPYTSLSYRNGPGAAVENRTDTETEEVTDPENPEYRQAALVPLESETHGGEDVAVYSRGPFAHLLTGTLEQHWIYHGIRYAMEFTEPE